MSNSLKRFLEKVVSGKAPGPSPTFSVLHLLLAIELMSENTIGRNKLAEKLNVGEGTVRTIIDRLKNANLITISKIGCNLTKKGMQLWNEYSSIVRKKIKIEKNELVLANHNFAVLLKNHLHKVKSGVEQRDAAVMVGAKGATTMMFKRRRLIIPSVSTDVAKDFPNASNQIFRLFEPEDNDVIIIGSGDTAVKAEYGTLAAAWALISDC